MKVIFLDIDGVLNCKSTPNPRQLPYIVDTELLMRFERVLASTGAAVVLSSTWRYDPAGCFSAEYHGIPFIDVTPDMPERPRREEILAWLSRRPEVSRYLVLDDEDDDLDDLPLFQPSSRTGLTDEIAQGMVDYLNGRTDKDMRSNLLVRLLQNVHSIFKGHEG
jgi:hypothetical protein